MHIKFDPKLKANLSLDNSNVVREINHFEELYLSEKESTPRESAIDYVEKVSQIVNIPTRQMEYANQMVNYFEPFEQDVEYRLFKEKSFFDSTTLGFYQTYLNVPVWRTGISITVKHSPNRIISMVNTSKYDLDAKLPTPESILLFRKLFATGLPSKEIESLKETENDYEKSIVSSRATVSARTEKISLEDILGTKPSVRKTKSKEAIVKNENLRLKMIRGRFYIYKYDSKNRQPHQEKEKNDTDFEHAMPSMQLPKVNESIQDGQYYVVAEITFSTGEMTWLMLVEIETKSVLYIEPLSSGLNGQVFLKDPISKTGVTTNTASQSNAVLNAFRDTVVLHNLNAPVSGIQRLRGRFANIVNVHDPNINAPTEPTGQDFNYNVRTNDFAAVNAYYHVDRFFAMVENLGFPINTYFNNTTFPIQVDHRALGNIINAHCVGNGLDGIQHTCFALADTSDLTNPVGISLDNIVVLHELGGHGILYEHVGGPNFGFAHSAGDSMGIINNDPDSALRQTADRFLFTPWVQLRRFDRDVTSWAWGGSNDRGGYLSEEILATTLFRIYRSIGGDSDNLNTRRFASEMMTYLILRTVSTFTPSTNPANALAFCNAMMAVDLLNWTTRGINGGAYNKVIRWSFERQGLFQSAGAPTPVTTAGVPPDVDVYIEDGRSGEYQFQAVHWACQSIWNRHTADGLEGHQEPILGQTNYAYVKIKNRGTKVANGITVKGYHCRPSAGVVWPNDLVQMAYNGGPIGTLNANSTQERIVGPFSWTPNVNAWGHDCIMMIVSATGDPSNVDNFTATESIEDWRLVPNDNNIAQRNVVLVPGGGGAKGLIAGLHEKSFWVTNPGYKVAVMKIELQIPEILKAKKWNISFKDIVSNEFKLKSREKKELVFNLEVGENFTKAELEKFAEREIVINAYADGTLIGGMSYYLDANIENPVNEIKKQDTFKCSEKAKDLLDCLNIVGQDVKGVKVKKVSIDIEMKADDCS